MIENAETAYQQYIDAGCNHLTVRGGSNSFTSTYFCNSRSGCGVGVVLNPGTPIEPALEILHAVDLVLIMSVNPGFGGQSFIPQVEKKVTKLRQAIDQQVKNGAEMFTQIDGALKPNIAKLQN